MGYDLSMLNSTGMFYRRIIQALRWSARRRAVFAAGEPKTVLLVELTRLGDVVCAARALAGFRRKFPSAKILLAVDSRYVSLIEEISPGSRVLGIPNSTRGPGFLAGISAARRERPDLACSLSPSHRNAMLTLCSGAGSFAGFLSPRPAETAYLADNKVEWFGANDGREASYFLENIADRPLKVLEVLGEGGFSYSRVAPPAVPSMPPTVVVHPFAQWLHKRWRLENFAALLDQLTARLGCRIALLCAPGEEEALGPLLKTKPVPQVLCSADFRAVARLLREAGVFVGNDSGPLHLAAALGTRVVGLYGPGTPFLCAPPACSGRFLYQPVECSPCDQTRCRRPNRHCMDLIPVSEVVEAVRGFVAELN